MSIEAIKHTPGPWYAEKKNVHTGSVATCHWDGEDWWEVYSLNWTDGSAEANARLIAAAPDLLNALTVLVDVAEARGIPCDAAKSAILKSRIET